MKLTVDRIEGDYAVCIVDDFEETVNVGIADIPFKVEEGDILCVTDGKWSKDEQARKELHDRINDKAKCLWED